MSKMKTFVYTSIFQKKIKKLQKKHYDMDLLRTVLTELSVHESLKGHFHDHALSGDLQGCRECHIQPNWLLIYRVKDDVIELVATGSHDELFK